MCICTPDNSLKFCGNQGCGMPTMEELRERGYFDKSPEGCPHQWFEVKKLDKKEELNNCRICIAGDLHTVQVCERYKVGVLVRCANCPASKELWETS